LPNSNGNVKNKGAKAVRGALENDVKAKIAEVEKPKTESEESGRNGASGRKHLEDFEANDEPTGRREQYGRLPLIQSRGEQQESWTPWPSVSPAMVDRM
jgi:hypothetical protein